MGQPDQTDSMEAGLENSPCLQGERVCFTGTLATMTHRQAMQLVEQHGGTATHDVSRQTTMLVVGEEGWPLDEDGQPSQKWLQTNGWKQEGLPVKLLKESEWLHLLGLEERRRDTNRLFTPAMLSEMLNVSVGTIRHWARCGWITPVQTLYRLPYFDYQEVTGLQRILQLLESGVSRYTLEESLGRLSSLLPETSRSLTQLDIVARDHRVLYRDQTGLVESRTGQRVFEFDAEETQDNQAQDDNATPLSFLEASKSAAKQAKNDDSRLRWDARDWFIEGCRFLEHDEPNSAIEAFRLALMQSPGDAETNMYLAESLYRINNVEGALERYYAAVEADHNYLEAWTQIGCIHAEQGRLTEAVESLQIALERHPDYADAHWHLAEVLAQAGEMQDAIEHWQTYLQFDQRGPWAEKARQQLIQAGASPPA